MRDEAHRVWLEDHPQYDEQWLEQAFGAGFDVHHLDGNHSNNDPLNLVLIEHSDHMKIHGQHGARIFGKIRNDWDKAKERLKLGEAAYNIRLEEGVPWDDVAERLGYKKGSAVLQCAAKFAKRKGKAWPIPHAPDCKCGWCSKHKRKGWGESAAEKRREELRQLHADSPGKTLNEIMRML